MLRHALCETANPHPRIAKKYVTWRDSSTAIIMFVKRKSFEGIINEAQGL